MTDDKTMTVEEALAVSIEQMLDARWVLNNEQMPEDCAHVLLEAIGRIRTLSATLHARDAEVAELEREKRVWLAANELLVKWKGVIDEARIVRRLPFPEGYDHSPVYALSTLIEYEREQAEAECARLREELESEKRKRAAADEYIRDAERYRWLRNNSGDYDYPFIAGKPGEPYAGEGWLCGESADVAIDALLTPHVEPVGINAGGDAEGGGA